MASAQNVIPIQLIATANGQIAVLANGSTLPFATPIGTSVTIQVTGTYVGQGKITIPQVAPRFWVHRNSIPWSPATSR